MRDLTVIIPSYNMQDGAVRAIESVLLQGVDVEIIVVDDGSVPPLILPEPFASLKSVKLVCHTENKGPSAARNTGVSNASCDWITFLDSDDVLVADTLACRLEFSKAKHKDTDGRPTLCGSGWLQRDKKKGGWIERTPLGALEQQEFASGCWYCPGSCIIGRRELFIDIPFDSRLRRLEDFDFGIRFGLEGGYLVMDSTIGAIICPSNITNTNVVGQSAEIMAQKFSHLIESQPDIWNAIRAYLNLELATTSFRERNWMKSIRALAASFVFKPRASLHFSPGWKISAVSFDDKRIIKADT